jgi:quinol monooxygenase YgiN
LPLVHPGRAAAVREAMTVESPALFYCATVCRLRILGIRTDDGRRPMTAFNAVRFRVKPGRDQEFLDAHKKIEATWPGLMHANIIKTGDRSYCIIAEWKDMDACIKARPNMVATLDSFRDTLEDLGGGLGVTDPAAGPVVLALK